MLGGTFLRNNLQGIFYDLLVDLFLLSTRNVPKLHDGLLVACVGLASSRD